MIRPYKNEDKPHLLALIRMHIPGAFHPDEEQDYAAYLEREREQYFIVEEGGRILGGGGINSSEDGTTARISWDLVHPDARGQGLGRKLVEHRLGVIRENPDFRTVTVRTSQHAYRFYEKMGFSLERIEHDFWAPGMHLYAMKMALDRNS